MGVGGTRRGGGRGGVSAVLSGLEPSQEWSPRASSTPDWPAVALQTRALSWTWSMHTAWFYLFKKHCVNAGARV